MPPIPADGLLFQEQGRPDVYWIRDGERLHIPNPYVMEALNLDWNAVQTVPLGGLDHIPLDLSWAPLGNATPGSVVHVPQNVGVLWNAGKVYWPLPVATTKQLVAWGQEVRTIELRGWIRHARPWVIPASGSPRGKMLLTTRISRTTSRSTALRG